MINTVGNAFTIIREKFHHIAVIGGPQAAGDLQRGEIAGLLAVTELNQWLWTPHNGSPAQILTDTEIESLSDPIEVFRTLTLSGQVVMLQLFHDIESVQADVQRNSDLRLMVGRSRSEVIIDQVFRMQSQSSPKSTGDKKVTTIAARTA